MMQSVAIILICIIVKYDCGVAVGDDRVESSMPAAAAAMPTAIVSVGNLVSVANKWHKPAVKQHSAIHQHFVNLYANDDGDKHMSDESSQPNKHDNDVTVMDQAENNANNSGNRIQHQRIDDDDDYDEHSDFNGTRMSRIKRQNNQRQNICDTQCVCRNDEKFLTVECNFKQVSQSSTTTTTIFAHNFFIKLFSIFGVCVVSHCSLWNACRADAPTTDKSFLF